MSAMLPPSSERFAIVLCGGTSRRMGCDKALVDFGGVPLVQHVVGQLSPIVSRVVLAAGPHQSLPPLPAVVSIVRDESPNAGPLAGLTSALRSLPDDDRPVYVTGVDYPFGHAGVINRLFDLQIGCDAAVTTDGDRLQPLVAVYARNRTLANARPLELRRDRSLQRLLSRLNIHVLDARQLEHIDPQRLSLVNVNTAEQLHRARQMLAQIAATDHDTAANSPPGSDTGLSQ